MTDATRPNLRTRKKQETRAALESAALRLFAEKGFDQTTVEEIAAEANVSPRTFARYFASKEAAAVGHPGEYLDAIREAVANDPETDERLVAANAMRVAAKGIEADRDLNLARMVLASREPSLRLKMYEWQLEAEVALLRALTARRPHAQPVLRVRLLANVMVGALLVAVRDWVRYEGKRPLVGLTDRVLADVECMLSGAPPAGDEERIPGSTDG